MLPLLDLLATLHCPKFMIITSTLLVWPRKAQPMTLLLGALLLPLLVSSQCILLWVRAVLSFDRATCTERDGRLWVVFVW